MRKILSVLAVLVIVLTAMVAHSEEKQKVILAITNEVERVVVAADGKREMKYLDTSKATVVPGDVVLYTIKYTNVSKDSVSNIVVVNPVPEHMVYRFGSVEGQGTDITFSVDGGKVYDIADKLFVTDKEGLKKPASVSDYTHIKWVVKQPLGPGKTGKVTYKAILK